MQNKNSFICNLNIQKNQQTFYTPVFEKIINPDLQKDNVAMWQWIDTQNKARHFFCTKEALFSSHPHASGCYKVIINQSDFCKNAKFNADSAITRPLNLWLVFAFNQIQSYVTRNNVEYQNPFIDQHDNHNNFIPN